MHFLAKTAFFLVFVSIVSGAMLLLKALVTPYIVDIPLLAVASYIGVLDALGVYFTIIMSGWGAKQLIAYARSL